MPNDDDFLKEESDFAYDRYLIQREYRAENDIPDDDLLPHDTRITQGISEGEDQGEDEPLYNYNEDIQALYDAPLPDIPDADEIQPGSPVDANAPDPDAMPGIDVLNGFDGDETK